MLLRAWALLPQPPLLQPAGLGLRLPQPQAGLPWRQPNQQPPSAAQLWPPPAAQTARNTAIGHWQSDWHRAGPRLQISHSCGCLFNPPPHPPATPTHLGCLQLSQLPPPDRGLQSRQLGLQCVQRRWRMGQSSLSAGKQTMHAGRQAAGSRACWPFQPRCQLTSPAAFSSSLSTSKGSMARADS